jgi:uncharacterized protein involved in exopolysaccharide biosynthesis
MNQGLDNSTPVSPSYRGTFRRHRKLFCVPVVLGALAAGFFLFGIAKSYTSTASLWVDTAPPVSSSVGANTGAPLTEPPSASVQGILSELLMTRSFASTVAETSLLGKSLGSAAAIQLKAEDQLGAGQIVQSAPGNQILTIGYSASSPAMAQSVLAAVVTQLRHYTDRLTAEHNQTALVYDRAQVKDDQTALTAARSQVTAYQAQHPGVTESDPNYSSLVSAEDSAATQLAQANTALSQVASTSDANGWLITVLDPPSPGASATPGKSKMLEVIFAGVLGGMFVSFLAVVALTPAKKEAWEDELPIGNPLSADMPPADPFRAKAPGVANGSMHPTPGTTAFGQRRLSLGDRRFHTPPVPTDER